MLERFVRCVPEPRDPRALKLWAREVGCWHLVLIRAGRMGFPATPARWTADQCQALYREIQSGPPSGWGGR
jgi:hypothetical protein